MLHDEDMIAPNEYAAELLAWQKSRPQYAKLLKAIRAEATESELFALATECGFTSVSSYQDLRGLRRMAKTKQAIADQLAERAKTRDALNKAWIKLDNELSNAPTRRAEDEIEQKMLAIADQRQQANRDWQEADRAAQIVAHAREAGVL